MSEIHREFERQLDGWHEQYADDVDREVLRLYLLALEREENVVVAYHDHVLGGRLATMAIPDGVRELMRHALASVRADEQMHVVAARTALRQLGRPMVAVRRYVHQFIGAMGGWTASVRQHRRWAEAPVSRATATLLLWAGRLTSRVPDTVRPHLDFLSFRDFCRYNVETEGTAWLCWQRLAELASHVPAFSGDRSTRCVGSLTTKTAIDASSRRSPAFLRTKTNCRTASPRSAWRFAWPRSADISCHCDGKRRRLASYRLWTRRTSTTPQSIERSRAARLVLESLRGSAKLRRMTRLSGEPVRRTAVSSRSR